MLTATAHDECGSESRARRAESISTVHAFVFQTALKWDSNAFCSSFKRFNRTMPYRHIAFRLDC